MTDGYFLGVTAKRDGARAVATPIAMSWHMDAGGEGPNYPSAIRFEFAVSLRYSRGAADEVMIRLILADVDEVFCLVLDAKGVPRLAAVACGEECKRGSRSAEQLWSLEEHEPYRTADLQSEIDGSGEGTTGWVSYLLGLSSA